MKKITIQGMNETMNVFFKKDWDFSVISQIPFVSIVFI